jgi:hypothetical protein
MCTTRWPARCHFGMMVPNARLAQWVMRKIAVNAGQSDERTTGIRSKAVLEVGV